MPVLTVTPGNFSDAILSDADLWQIAQSIALDDETIDLVHFVRSLRSSKNLPVSLIDAIAEVDRQACALLKLRLAGISEQELNTAKSLVSFQSG